MNLDVFDILLCFAFQISDGPFSIIIFRNGSKEDRSMMKEELFKLSEDKNIICISLTEEIKDRRWRDR